MTILKKLILSLMILCSTSLFAGGFDTPTEAFNFYYKLAVKASAYKIKHGHFKKEHINAMAPNVWSNRNPPETAERILGAHHAYILSAQSNYSDRYPMIVSLNYLGPVKDYGYKRNGKIVFYYSYYKFQKKKRYVRKVELVAKKVGNKMKWFII